MEMEPKLRLGMDYLPLPITLAKILLGTGLQLMTALSEAAEFGGQCMAVGQNLCTE